VDAKNGGGAVDQAAAADAAIAERLGLRTATPVAASPTKAPGGQHKTGWEEKFLETYIAWGHRGEAAKAAGVSIQTVRNREKSSPEFAAQVAEAHETFVDGLELDLVKLGRHKNNALAIMMRLKAERPHRYEDKLRVDAAVKSMNLNVVATADEAKDLLRQMLADATDITKAQLAASGQAALVAHEAAEAAVIAPETSQ
jgi:hypothetical protein